MILKSADDKFPSVAKLEVLLKTGRIPTEKVPLVEKELRAIRSGIKGEEESAYQIDFHLRDSKNTMILHDLRFELPDGRVAQIDHLLIHRSYRAYVLETKNFSHGVKITDQGEFLRWNDWRKNFEGIPSPIEQNTRHVVVLERIIESLGLPISAIRAFILIAPTARIDRSKKFDSSMVVKADQFLSALDKDLNDIGVFSLLGGIAKAKWNGSFEEIGKKLLACHKPIAINYVAKFGLAKPQAPSTPTEGPQARVVAHSGPSTPEPAPLQAQALATSTPYATEKTHKCRACGKSNLTVEYGKYGYYFKCHSCAGNTPIKLDCGHTGHKERLRKDGTRFFRECAGCKTSTLFFTNPRT
jgi:hypothetical protein